MPALVADIHALTFFDVKTWMAGTRPAMTLERSLTFDERDP
jgi:hypothetical protein